jgi:signal transduction histidine kinase
MDLDVGRQLESVRVDRADHHAALRRTLVRQQRLLQQQESLRVLVEAISGELELRPLLLQILRHACDLIGAQVGTIGLVDTARDLVRTEAAFNMPESEIGAEMPRGVGIAGQVLSIGRPIHVRRYGDLPSPTQLDLVDHEVLGMPIIWRDRMIGFFGLGMPSPLHDERGEIRPPRFTRRDMTTLRVFARHAAIAIVNARRYADERRRIERLELIAHVGRLVTANLQLDDLLQQAADALHEVLGYPNVAIPLIESNDPGMLVLRTVGGAYKHIVVGEYRIPVTQGLMGAAARAREPVLVNDVESDPRYLPTPGATGIRAELAVPILLGDRCLGVVNVESSECFGELDAMGLRIVAAQLAVAIENARLYASTRHLAVVEERRRLARDLHDAVTQSLFSMTLIAQTIGDAYRADPSDGDRRVARLLEIGTAAHGELRALLAELRPAGRSSSVDDRPGQADAPRPPGVAQLEREGLAAALRAHAAGIALDGPIIRLDDEGYRRQPLDHEWALFRIAQEGLHNVVKHARASRVDVCLTTDGDGATTLTICDDGVGLPVEARSVRERRRFGLETMGERAEAIGGTVVLHSAPDEGVRLEVRLPPRDATGGPRPALDRAPDREVRA